MMLMYVRTYVTINYPCTNTFLVYFRINWTGEIWILHEVLCCCSQNAVPPATIISCLHINLCYTMYNTCRQFLVNNYIRMGWTGEILRNVLMQSRFLLFNSNQTYSSSKSKTDQIQRIRFGYFQVMGHAWKYHAIVVQYLFHNVVL